MMMSLTSIPINFKEVFTTNTRTLHLNPNWTVNQFLDTVKPIIEREYQCERGNLDIVASGQDAPGIPAEAGLPVEPSEIRIKYKWGIRLSVAFYIRRKNVIYPQLQNLNRNLQADQEVNPIIIHSAVNQECPVCLTSCPMINRYSCIHQICTDCYYKCLNAYITNCSLCRSN
jgi:hypothetical protein